VTSLKLSELPASARRNNARIPDYLADYYDAAETDTAPPHFLEAFRMRGEMIQQGAAELGRRAKQIEALEAALTASRERVRELEAGL
jgi:hypothetical protein